MKFIQNLKSKNIISHVLHALFNAGFALLIFLSIYIGGQIEVALLLVAISKWRILAVRSRYWGVNLLANLVDITVGFSMVGLMYFATDIKEGGLWVQAGLAILYAIWLIVIKPLSGRRAAKIQAGTGLFLGIWCIMATAHVVSVIPFLVEIFVFIVGYGSARHILSTHKEDQITLLASIFGLVLVEVCWILSHWTIGYGIYLSNAFKMPQAAIIAVFMGIIFERFYASTRTGRSTWMSEYSAPIMFSMLAIIVMLAYFSSAVSI